MQEAQKAAVSARHLSFQLLLDTVLGQIGSILFNAAQKGVRPLVETE